MGSTVAALVRGLSRHPVLLVNIVLLMGLAGAGLGHIGAHAIVSSPTPADLFMQSIATDNADLGWAQLCPTLRDQLPREVLDQQTLTQHALQSRQGLTLTIEHVADRSRPAGGEIRFYVATAHNGDGATGQKTYAIETQASGCVEGVE